MYDLEQRLERGELISLPRPPFALPSGGELALLLQQQPRTPSRFIVHDPRTGELSGHHRAAGQSARLGSILAAHSASVHAWLSAAFPRYAAGLEPDRVTFRPLEEATRFTRRNARKDLLHIDAFPSRPARGRRILRV